MKERERERGLKNVKEERTKKMHKADLWRVSGILDSIECDRNKKIYNALNSHVHVNLCLLRCLIVIHQPLDPLLRPVEHNTLNGIYELDTDIRGQDHHEPESTAFIARAALGQLQTVVALHNFEENKVQDDEVDEDVSNGGEDHHTPLTVCEFGGANECWPGGLRRSCWMRRRSRF